MENGAAGYAQRVPLARQGGVPTSGLSGAQTAETRPLPSPGELPSCAEGTTLGTNHEHSL